MSLRLFDLKLNKELHEKINRVENFENDIKKVQILDMILCEPDAFKIGESMLLPIVPERSKEAVHEATDDGDAC